MNCPQCGTILTKRGFRSGRQRYQCSSCKRWTSELTLPTVKDQTPKILFFDIETLPIEAVVWGIHEQHISTEHILKDWCMLAFAAMWLGEEDEQILISGILTPQEALDRDDRRIVEKLWKLLDEADIVIAHNGDGYDIPKARTRFLHHKLYNPKPFRTVDTLKIARSQFALTSNKLDYLLNFLGYPGKLETNLKLWIDCAKGNEDALKRMSTYCRADVVKLQEVYMALLPYIPNHPNVTLWRDGGDCPNCGSENTKADGKHATTTYLFDAKVCNDCHSRWRSRKK